MRDRNEHVEGLHEPHELEVAAGPRARAAVHGQAAAGRAAIITLVDANLNVRIPVKAGPHERGVTFLKKPSSLLETERQPYQAHFNMHRHPRIRRRCTRSRSPARSRRQGPGDTPSRRRIFVCQPTKPADEEACAKRILSTLMRRAYRRPVTDADLQTPLEFYREARGGRRISTRASRWR